MPKRLETQWHKGTEKDRNADYLSASAKQEALP